jgi:hypothetical protein
MTTLLDNYDDARVRGIMACHAEYFNRKIYTKPWGGECYWLEPSSSMRPVWEKHGVFHETCEAGDWLWLVKSSLFYEGEGELYLAPSKGVYTDRIYFTISSDTHEHMLVSGAYISQQPDGVWVPFVDTELFTNEIVMYGTLLERYGMLAQDVFNGLLQYHTESRSGALGGDYSYINLCGTTPGSTGGRVCCEIRGEWNGCRSDHICISLWVPYERNYVGRQYYVPTLNVEEVFEAIEAMIKTRHVFLGDAPDDCPCEMCAPDEDVADKRSVINQH